jgi:hypothetical protein
MSFVYLIASGGNIIKIGKANDVGKRVRALQTGQPFSLRIIHRIEVAQNDVLKLEKAIHKKLKRYVLRGEWFRIEPAVAISAAKECAELLAKGKERLRRSETEIETQPGTIARFVYCPTCFHRGRVTVPIGTMPAFRCSQCGEAKPLVGGRDPIRPWWKARAERLGSR